MERERQRAREREAMQVFLRDMPEAELRELYASLDKARGVFAFAVESIEDEMSAIAGVLEERELGRPIGF